VKKFLSNQQGQGVLEYVILSGLIGVFCLVAVKQFGEVIQNRLNNMREHVVENIRLK
jgi:Flp pilus assembly pilin Flp